MIKSKLPVAAAVIAILAVAVFALNQNHSIHFGNADCCLKKADDSCPMKEKQAKSDEKSMDEDCPMKAKSSESDKMSCDNCPMKEKMANSEKPSCDDDCPMKARRDAASPDNCPMKAKREKQSTVSP